MLDDFAGFGELILRHSQAALDHINLDWLNTEVHQHPLRVLPLLNQIFFTHSASSLVPS